MSTIEVVLDATAYSADAIQRAAYKYCDRFSLELRRMNDAFYCKLHFADETDSQGIASEFRTEVLDQVLRARIRSETEGVRNLILALAFSNAPIDDAAKE